MKIKKAVFPVAGLGTRFLPATKAMPKEQLEVLGAGLSGVIDNFQKVFVFKV